jgi:hypothetical protein
VIRVLLACPGPVIAAAVGVVPGGAVFGGAARAAL